MNGWKKAAAALALGLGALGVTAASADDRDRDRDRREQSHRDGDRRDGDRHDGDRSDGGRRDGDRRSDHRRDDHRYDSRRNDNRRGDDHRRNDRRGDDHRRNDHRYDSRRTSSRGYVSVRPSLCSLDHDHRIHNRDYYSYYPKDRYYRSDPSFAFSIVLGNGGYYDRGGRYYNSPYYDRRGYRDYGRVVNRETIRLRNYRADAVLIEEVYSGRRGSDLVCTVTARGPDARYVPYGQLRSIAARYCSRRADIRIYA